jgi:hypothetical protein
MNIICLPVMGDTQRPLQVIVKLKKEVHIQQPTQNFLNVGFVFFIFGSTGIWTQVLCLLGKHSIIWATPLLFLLYFSLKSHALDCNPTIYAS